MFSPVPMRRLQAVVLARDERAVLRSLGELGVVHLTRAEADSTSLSPPDHREEIARCDRLLTRVDEVSIPHSVGASTTLTLADAEATLSELAARVADLRQRRQAVGERLNELVETSARVAPYRELALTLEQLGAMEFLHVAAGRVLIKDLPELKTAIGDDVVLWPLAGQGDRQPLVTVCPRDRWPAVEAVLLQSGFSPETLSPIPVRELEQTQADLARLNGEWETQCKEGASALAMVEQAAHTERRLLEAEQLFPCSAAAVLITGWVPAAESEVVESGVREMTGGRCVVEWCDAESLPEEQVPVLLRPPRFVRPFAMLVEAFGLPRYREVEPTVFMALSYVLMFGMMFGDVGHGVVLALAGGWMWRTGRRLGVLLVYAGIASCGFGVVYGSYFGITALKHYALWRDPAEGDPVALMMLAIGIGVVMISLGQVLNIVNSFRRRDYFRGLLDKAGVAGVVFYWGTLGLVTKYAAFAARGFVTWAIVLFVAVPVACWLIKEPLIYWQHRRAGQSTEEGGLVGALAESAVGAFEAVFLYLANTISFVRLAGFAMSHAALLLAAFLLAAELQRAGGLGTAVGVLVIIAGNLLAIILEGMIAAVQALRLEYYEFFGKFFSGDGLAFQPFQLDSRKHPPTT